MVLNVNQSLSSIQQNIEQLDTKSLNPQQDTFIQHIHKSAISLRHQLEHLPNSNLAHLMILPTMNEPLIQSVVAIYGYAKLLLDSPQSFDGATIPTKDRPYLENIYSSGRELQHYLESLYQQALEYRQQARQKTSAVIDLQKLIVTHIDIYRFWLYQQTVTLELNEINQPTNVRANTYHLNALIQHILITTAKDIITMGNELHLYIKSNQHHVQLWIDCADTSLEENHIQTLFDKDGRHIYWQHIQNLNGKFVIHPQSISTFILALPRYAL